MSKTYGGGCECGRIRIELEVPKPLEDHVPRACQCDYCQLNGGVFFSDPDGRATIYGEEYLVGETQGSQQARMLLCGVCRRLVCATYSHDGKCLGAVSALFIGTEQWLKDAMPVSPEDLSPEEKAGRWAKLWMPIEFR